MNRFNTLLIIALVSASVFLAPPQRIYAASFHQQVGIGFTDVIPHQIVRASDDRVYMFTSSVSSNNVRAYWSNAAGTISSSTTYSSAVLSTGSQRGISLTTAYAGGNTILALINSTTGNLVVYPFDITTKTFATPITLETGLATSPQDIGTSGLSAMFDKTGALHVAFWGSGNHIKHRAYTYNSSTNTFTPATALFQVDTAGTANHPVLAISPLDNSVVIAWVSQVSTPASIQARIKSSAGTWGNVSTISTAAVWTSPNSGLNIDQGPSMVIGTDGVVHLIYMQDWENPFGSGYDYGRSHYVSFNGSTWTDQPTAFFTHDPAIAINSANQVFILGHGHSWDTGCTRLIDLCQVTRNSNGTWQAPQMIVQAQGSQDFDSSVSVKWSINGWNRPDLIEFGFFSAPYDNPVLYYGQFSTTTISSSSSSSISSSSSSSATTTSSSSATTTSTSSASSSTPACTVSNCPQADIDLNHIVNGQDYAILANDFFKVTLTNPRADINGDSLVDLTDYSLYAIHFGRTY